MPPKKKFSKIKNLTVEILADLRVDELRYECRTRNLKSGGSKAVLIERLTDFLKNSTELLNRNSLEKEEKLPVVKKEIEENETAQVSNNNNFNSFDLDDIDFEVVVIETTLEQEEKIIENNTPEEKIDENNTPGETINENSFTEEKIQENNFLTEQEINENNIFEEIIDTNNSDIERVEEFCEEKIDKNISSVVTGEELCELINISQKISPNGEEICELNIGKKIPPEVSGEKKLEEKIDENLNSTPTFTGQVQQQKIVEENFRIEQTVPVDNIPKQINANREEFEMDEEYFLRLDQPFDDSRVTLDPYNADLNFKIIDSDRLFGEPLSQEGFAFMLASVRASYGFNRGKVGFEVKMLETVDVSNVKPEEQYPHEIRVGWSICESSLRLGESMYSFAYCNNGKKANGNVFAKIGQCFDVGDVIGCLIDFDTMQINFLVNGKFVAENTMPVFNIPEELRHSDGKVRPFFPHICVKNIKFQVNFGHMECQWHGLPDGYVFVDAVPLDLRYRGPIPPLCKEKCTVLCMVGLPGCGKTTWVRQFLQSQTDVRWTVLSTNTVLEQMKVQGEPRKKRHQGRWDMMMGVVVKCLNRLLMLACRMRKNYILDMTNVYPLPRRKKMIPFKEFKRKAMVIVPTVEDYANRCLQQMRHEGKQMPSDAMLEMKACFTLPKEDEEIFDDIEFVELQRDDAQKVIDYFNEEGKSFKPRERKRRSDWQQEELPPKQVKPPGAPQLAKPSQPHIGPANRSTMSKSNANYPYGVPPSLRPYPSTSTFTRQWSTAAGGGGNLSNQNQVQIQSSTNTSTATTPIGWSQLRGNASGYTPRAGWPANWPQASWNMPGPSSATSVNGSQFTFPPPPT